VRLAAVLLPPPDATHPGGFDYARQVWFERIGAVGFAVSAPELLPPPAEPSLGVRLAMSVELVRAVVAERIESRIAGEAGGIAAALVTGYRGGIPDDAQEALRVAGLAHILAISGLHMMLVVGTLFWGVRALLALSPGLALTRPIKKWAAAVALVGGAAYLVLSGGAIATQRAFIMAAIMMVAILVDRPAITLRNIAIAAMVVLVLTPEALLSASFQMSFAATIALVAGYEALRERRTPQRWRAGLVAMLRRHVWQYVFALVMTALIAGFATAPYAAFHFNRVAVYGLIGNVGAMPLVGTLIMPPGLIAMCLMPFGLDGPFLWLMGQGIDMVLAVARAVAGLEGAVAVTPAFSLWSLGLMTLGGLWLALWRGRWRCWGLAGLAAGFLLAPLAPQSDLYISRDAGMVAPAQG
jgi:competence protein ComEC